MISENKRITGNESCRIEAFWNGTSECPKGIDNCYDCFFYLSNEEFEIKEKKLG